MTFLLLCLRTFLSCVGWGLCRLFLQGWCSREGVMLQWTAKCFLLNRGPQGVCLGGDQRSEEWLSPAVCVVGFGHRSSACRSWAELGISAGCFLQWFCSAWHSPAYMESELGFWKQCHSNWKCPIFHPIKDPIFHRKKKISIRLLRSPFPLCTNLKQTDAPTGHTLGWKQEETVRWSFKTLGQADLFKA